MTNQMPQFRYGYSLLAVVLILGVVAVLVTGMLLFKSGIAIRRFGGPANLPTRPQVSLALEIEGVAVTQREVRIRPGSELIPVVTVSPGSDHPAQVWVDMNAEELTSGERIKLDKMGSYLFVGCAKNRHGTLAMSQPIYVEVAKDAVNQAVALVEDCGYSRNNRNELGTVHATILVAAADFDAVDLHLPSVDLRLLASDGQPLISGDSVYIEGAYPEGGPRFDSDNVRAKFFPEGYWRLHFKADYSGRGVVKVPELFILIGAVWGKESGQIKSRFKTPAQPLQADPVPVSTLARMGMLKKPEPAAGEPFRAPTQAGNPEQ